MSRTTIHNLHYELAYGHDHVFGFFIQVFDMFRQTDDDPGLVVDLDGENGLTPEKMVEIAKEYGFDIPVLDRRMAFN